MRVLYADADAHFAGRISEQLTKQGCAADIAADGSACVSFAEFDVYDVIVIDSSLCPEDALQMIGTLRGSKNASPLLYIGAKRSVEEAVCVLDAGADDYMSKPFSMAEFSARLRALARRKHTSLEFKTLAYRDLTLDLNTNELLCNDKVVRLGVKKFQLLRLLIESGAQVIPKERLAEKVWGINSYAEYNNVEVYISFLRKKLKKLGSQVTINSLRNMGYVLGIASLK